MRVRQQRDRLRAKLLDCHRGVVLQVAAHTLQLMRDGDAQRSQVVWIADTGELQQLRGIHSAAAENNLPLRADGPSAATNSIFEPRSLTIADNDAQCSGARDDQKVGAIPNRMKIGMGGTPSLGALHCTVSFPDTILAAKIEVVVPWQTHLLRGLDERFR